MGKSKVGTERISNSKRGDKLSWVIKKILNTCTNHRNWFLESFDIYFFLVFWAYSILSIVNTCETQEQNKIA